MKSLTDRIGTDYIKWMREKGYENMPIDGYILVRTDYPASLVIIDGVLVVTLWYDDPPVATPTQEAPIEIPKTGGGFPTMTFALSGLCWLVAAFCAVTLVKGGWKRPVLAMDGGSLVAEVEPEPEPPAAVKTHNRKRKRRKKGRG